MTDYWSGKELYKWHILSEQIRESYPGELQLCQNYTGANLKGSHGPKRGQKNNEHNAVKSLMMAETKSNKHKSKNTKLCEYLWR